MRVLSVDRTSASGALALHAVNLAEKVTRPFLHRGFFKLARWCGQLASADQRCTVDLAPDAKFRFFVTDPYWNRLVSKRFHYEEDMRLVLRRFTDVDYWFIDAGANYGYWSVLVTSQSYGAKSAVAIEPVTRTFRALEENCALNGGRFTPLQMAVAEEAGGRVVIQYSRSTNRANAAASLVQQGEPEDHLDHETIESTSINEVLEEFVPRGRPVVLKLDVEGMEVPALRGAAGLGNHEWLLIYEDHGNDVSCRATEFVMTLDASLFLVTRRGKVHRVDTLDRVRKFKTDSRAGYNFFAASRGGVFERRLAEAASA
jgi:FkbM family methyltransferase